MARLDSYGDPDTSRTVLVGVVGAILTVAVIIGLQGFFYRMQSAETVSKVYQTDDSQYKKLRIDQEADLHRLEVLDAEKGIVAIPIDQAMKRVEQELAHQRPADNKDSQVPHERE
jgi:diphthamide biosynthesis methyltransferase